MVAAQRELFAEQQGIAARTVYAGVGEGGDRALAIDRRCEDIVFAELERLHAEGHEFTAISEERGEVAFGDPGAGLRVIIDPLDGSLNARRMLPTHSLSFAVAIGSTMADVELGYVYDFGAAEEYFARRGQGATLDGQELRAQGPGYGLEVVGIESAKPERTVPLLEALAGQAYRIRAVGSIAISLCYVAGGRFDGMLTGRACRSVDAAAGQLIAREAGAEVGLRRGRPGREPRPRGPLPRRRRPRSRAAGQRAPGPGAGRAAAARVMTANGFVDWRLAERVALALGGNDVPSGPFDQEALDAACAEAVALALDYSRLRPAGELPRPELVDRAEWARLGLRTLRELSVELERQIADGLSLPGPLGGIARSLAGAAAGAEAGIAVGYGARKVLGQYDVSLVADGAAATAGVRGRESRRRPQRARRGPWTSSCAGSRSTRAPTRSSSPRSPGSRAHLGELSSELIGGASSRLDPGFSPGPGASGCSAATRAPRFAPSCAATSPACSRVPSRGAPWIASRRRCP